MSASQLLSTDAVAPRDRAPQWCEWISQHFCGLQSDLYGDTDFDGQLAASRAGDVILTRLEANRHRVVRTATMARGSEVPYLKIVAPWQGSATVQQQQREACARDGAWVIYDTTGSYEIGNPERVDHLIVMVPKDGLAERSQRLDGVMARRLGASGISRVALETMRHTYQELPNMSAAAAAVTSRIRLGTWVASPNFRHPVPFAKDVMGLDDISGGRFVLGLGAGGEGWDASVMGPPPSRGERHRRFAEFVALLDELLTHPVTDTVGDWYTAHLARMIPGTLAQTTLGIKQPGTRVNLEVDVIAKYTEKLLGRAQAEQPAPIEASR